MTTVSRRRVFGSLAITAGYTTAVEAQNPSLSLELLRHVSEAHGTNLSDDRLGVLKPVLESRRPQLRTLRAFEVSDAVEPTQGILDK